MKDVYVGSGKLAGKGVYAARDFKKDELVTNWNLKPLTNQEFDALPKSERMFVHTFKGKLYLFPEPSRYTNHSAKPTVYSDFEKQCDYALRDIKKGEPITVDSKVEIKYELETFLQSHEGSKITNFTMLSGGYRNAEVRYTVKNATIIAKLKRIEGNWQILN